MGNLQIFFQLTRLNRPIGILLLFWPCLWGLSLGYYFSGNTVIYLKHIILFFLGSILMRSAGCIINDIVDKDFDKKVERTKERPIASGKISILNALLYAIILCLIALLILLQFNLITIILGMASMILAFVYPFMKRFTYWPQLFLGITFNWGIIIAGSSILNTITPEIILLYIGAIFWTLGYDTIYGYQDIKDDEIIGVKSTSIKFKNNPKKFISLCYFLSICFFVLVGLKGNYGLNYYILLIFPIAHMMNQIFKMKIKDNLICLKIFKSNNFFGLLIFLTLIFK